jgi:hypothetical protein
MIPKLITYWGGKFRLIKENLPESIRYDGGLHNKALILLAHKYSYYNWGDMLPSERIDEMNTYIYGLLEEYFIRGQNGIK